MRFSFAVWR